MIGKGYLLTEKYPFLTYFIILRDEESKNFACR